MFKYQIFSRRSTPRKVDFKPDMAEDSPYVQLRRLSAYLQSTVATADDITDCDDAIAALREYTYRKIFTSTSHEDYLRLDKEQPEVIDWLVAIHETESSHFQTRKQSNR